MTTDDWLAPLPHVVTIDVRADDIDIYDHVNNSVYLTWFDRAAWSHSSALGVTPEDCRRMRRGMAAVRVEVDYLRAAVPNDRVEVATWIVDPQRGLRVERRFQVRHSHDGATLAKARVTYVCLNLDSGRAVRMPPEFVAAYVERVRAARPR
jgi:acyl-CoA thioester hydrolase